MLDKGAHHCCSKNHKIKKIPFAVTQIFVVCLLHGSCNTATAFEAKIITNELHLPFSREVLRILVSLSRQFLVTFIVRNKSKIHDYAVTLKHPAIVTSPDQQFQTSGFFHDSVVSCRLSAFDTP